ncbi:MAG: PDZ domain-containing protein [Ruminococcus sp.]|jgi:carboxyl-terminal processing protease|nr:PDZ domain-containing protein [Ruminococcus sp.]
MNKKISLGLAIAIAALVAAAAVIFTYNYALDRFNSMISSVSDKEENYTRISELDTFVRASYIGLMDEKVLLDSILEGYTAGIGDMNAEYFTAAETQAMNTDDTGYKVGLGFGYEPEGSGYIIITDVLIGSDAETLGLRAGDIITAVNNTDVIHFSAGYDEATALMNGDEGTKVKLYVKRTAEDGVAEYFDIELESKRFEIVTVFTNIYDTIGLIRITAFNDRTDEELSEAIDSLISQGAESLIFDIRDNPGGSIATLESVLDKILGAGDIVTAYYRDSETVVVKTTEADVINMPMTVLMNERTTGTAELFASALKDEAGAQLVGVSTAGKGMLQETHKLGSGGSIRLSVAYLKTSSKRDFDRIGIKPDFEVKLPEGVLISDIPETLRLSQDTQLVKAIEVAGTF